MSSPESVEASYGSKCGVVCFLGSWIAKQIINYAFLIHQLLQQLGIKLLSFTSETTASKFVFTSLTTSGEALARTKGERVRVLTTCRSTWLSQRESPVVSSREGGHKSMHSCVSQRGIPPCVLIDSTKSSSSKKFAAIVWMTTYKLWLNSFIGHSATNENYDHCWLGKNKKQLDS